MATQIANIAASINAKLVSLEESKDAAFTLEGEAFKSSVEAIDTNYANYIAAIELDEDAKQIEFQVQMDAFDAATDKKIANFTTNTDESAIDSLSESLAQINTIDGQIDDSLVDFVDNMANALAEEVKDVIGSVSDIEAILA